MEVPWPKKFDLFGLGVSAVDYDQVEDHVARAVDCAEPAVVSCHAVHAVVTISRHQELRESANEFEIITPDGQPVRWALNSLYGTRLKDRVYGPELMRRLLARSEKDGHSIYLYGGSQTTLDKLTSNIQRDFPTLKIAGTKSPPFRELSNEELEEIADSINDSGADLVFIGLGCPKQDAFAAAQKHRINAVQICVGAAFDFHAGTKPMAPKWMQASGLEWLYRLGSEPRRLFRRYIETNSIFIWCFLKAMLSQKLGYTAKEHSDSEHLTPRSFKSDSRAI